jgi:hypothetical protein
MYATPCPTRLRSPVQVGCEYRDVYSGLGRDDEGFEASYF